MAKITFALEFTLGTGGRACRPLVFLFALLALSCGGGGGDTNSSAVEPREVIVDPSGNGDYRGIQQAVRDAVPGTVITVRAGTYNENIVFRKSGTAERPITLRNYPDEMPIIIPGTGLAQRVELNAEYIIVEGFEILGGYDGIKIYKSNNIVRYNYVHNNKFTGILVAATTGEISNVLIENNTVESNGFEPGTGNPYPGLSLKNVHGIYISDFACVGTSNITIRLNTILGHGGRAIQWNGNSCETKMRNTLVEENLIENNSWGLALFYNVEGAVITNNVFNSNSRPETNDTLWTFFGIWGSDNNIISGNTFNSSLPDVAALIVVDEQSTHNTVDENTWRVAGNKWIWEGEERTDWTSYPELTGWDVNGDVCLGCN
jgi:parallel beta-helix repeat protein